MSPSHADASSFGNIPSSRIAGSYDSSISSFLRVLHIMTVILIYAPINSIRESLFL
jgi:hypothetical protein